ncbi:aldose epimerase family protein [Lactiplantibacillus plantarum]
MATVELKNDKIKVVVSLLGAEIQAVTRIDDGFDYIWNDTTGKYWGRHAPILFPIIGQINQNTYYFDGKKYSLTQHGFLRDQTFEVVNQSEDAVSLKSTANDETKAKFPFDYQVTVTYSLADSALKVEFNVENFDTKTMY